MKNTISKLSVSVALVTSAVVGITVGTVGLFPVSGLINNVMRPIVQAFMDRFAAL